MAVIQPTITDISGDGSAFLYSWHLVATNTAAPAPYVEWGDRSAQCEGTFDSAVISLQGSNNSTTGVDGNFQTLKDPGANDITWSGSAALKQVLQASRWIKPAITTAGSGGVDVVVSLVLRRSNTMRT